MAIEAERKYRIFISAAEPSADSHCAAVIDALKRMRGNFEFVGVGGAKMAGAGCELLENTSDKAVMIYKAFTAVLRFVKLLFRIKRYFKNNHVDLVVLCDSPAFNFHVAKAAKKIGIKTLFYVAPQLWAWAPWRIKKLKACCDKLCCILPFEEEWFSQKGIDVTFVGNPLLDNIEGDLKKNKKDYRGFDVSKVKLALMPGSRSAEIKTLWPVMQSIAVKLKKKYPRISITTTAVDNNKKEVLRSLEILGFKCEYSIGTVLKTARESDFTLVASGSATLQVAAAGCPMIIMYQSNKLIWHLLGRWLIKTKYLSLVNILAKKELVPEFMPYLGPVETMTGTIVTILEDKTKLSQVSNDLVELVKPLQKGQACENVAKIIVENCAINQQ